MRERIFSSLAGCWSFTRRISEGTLVKGLARFSSLGPRCLRYIEEGTLTTAQGVVCDCYRNYLYRLENGEIHVFFDETPPRFFHALVFSADEQSAGGEHLCGQDLYKATYYFLDTRTFTLTYAVQGPAKDYQMITEFHKEDI